MAAPTILLTNDDGVDAPGILVLARALEGLGKLYICAPLENQSGVGSALTVGRLVDFKEMPPTSHGVKRMAVNGTPVDAVKYALREWLPHQPPVLVVSGINLGANIGRNVRYSGTLGAAFESYWSGFPTLAVSMDYSVPSVWDAAAHYARVVASWLLSRPPEPGILSLNAPALPVAEVKGLRLGGMGSSGYVEVVAEEKADGSFDISAAMEKSDPADAALDGALMHANYAALTPLGLDWTDHARLKRLLAEGEVEKLV